MIFKLISECKKEPAITICGKDNSRWQAQKAQSGQEIQIFEEQQQQRLWIEYGGSMSKCRQRGRQAPDQGYLLSP